MRRGFHSPFFRPPPFPRFLPSKLGQTFIEIQTFSQRTPPSEGDKPERSPSLPVPHSTRFRAPFLTGVLVTLFSLPSLILVAVGPVFHHRAFLPLPSPVPSILWKALRPFSMFYGPSPYPPLCLFPLLPNGLDPPP